jgi:hypothetical protein
MDSKSKAAWSGMIVSYTALKDYAKASAAAKVTEIDPPKSELVQ